MKKRPFLLLLAAIIGAALLQHLQAMTSPAKSPVATSIEEGQLPSGVVCTVCGPISRGADPVAPSIKSLPGLSEMKFRVVEGIERADSVAPASK